MNDSAKARTRVEENIFDEGAVFLLLLEPERCRESGDAAADDRDPFYVEAKKFIACPKRS
jgi:hypothetical protein